MHHLPTHLRAVLNRRTQRDLNLERLLLRELSLIKTPPVTIELTPPRIALHILQGVRVLLQHQGVLPGRALTAAFTKATRPRGSRTTRTRSPDPRLATHQGQRTVQGTQTQSASH
jgi:hypothetical protein